MTFKIAEARHDLMNNTAVIVAHESSAGAGPQPTPSCRRRRGIAGDAWSLRRRR
jgi:hypothetical protein